MFSLHDTMFYLFAVYVWFLFIVRFRFLDNLTEFDLFHENIAFVEPA